MEYDTEEKAREGQGWETYDSGVSWSFWELGEDLGFIELVNCVKKQCLYLKNH